MMPHHGGLYKALAVASRAEPAVALAVHDTPSHLPQVHRMPARRIAQRTADAFWETGQLRLQLLRGELCVVHLLAEVLVKGSSSQQSCSLK